jgi:hypothetical protein
MSRPSPRVVESVRELQSIIKPWRSNSASISCYGPYW